MYWHENDSIWAGYKASMDLSIACHHILLKTLRIEYIIYFYFPIKPSLDELMSAEGEWTQ